MPSMRKPKASQRSGSSLASAPWRYLVFLSHSTRDTWIASAVAERIRLEGGEVWIDIDELVGGDSIYQKIIEAVDSCDEAIVLMSPHSVNSGWVLFELGAICGQRKRVTPILTHVEPSAIPVMPGIKAVDINQLDHLFLPDLAQRIAAKRKGGL
jgi:TIR domain